MQLIHGTVSFSTISNCGKCWQMVIHLPKLESFLLYFYLLIQALYSKLREIWEKLIG